MSRQRTRSVARSKIMEIGRPRVVCGTIWDWDVRKRLVEQLRLVCIRGCQCIVWLAQRRDRAIIWGVH